MVAQEVKLLLGVPETQIGGELAQALAALLQLQFPADAKAEEVQVLWLLPPTGKTQMEIQAAGFGLSCHVYCSHLGVNQQMLLNVSPFLHSFAFQKTLTVFLNIFF